MQTINSSDSQTAGSNRSLERLDRFRRWYSGPFLSRVMPNAVRDLLRESGLRILAPYAMLRLPRDREFKQSVEDAEASAEFSIVIPVHDAPEVTERCLRSLERYAPKAEIILIDDASKLNETKALLDGFASRNGWKLIRNAEAKGHSAACEAGGAIATRPYLCLLNSDTVVTPWCWRPIARAFEGDIKIGVAGPSTSFSGTVQTLPLVCSARHRLNDSQICAYAESLLTEASSAAPKEISWVSGFAFFIRKGVWEQLGGFDRNFPDLGNEWDFCRRALRAGHRVVWVRSSYIHHFGGVSYKNNYLGVLGKASDL